MPMVQAGNLPYSGVPTVEPDVGQPSRFDSTRADPAAFGSQIGQAVSTIGRDIGQAGDVLASAAIRQQELDNQLAADNATNQYQDAETRLLRGDPDKPGDTGYFGKRGQDAQTAFGSTRDAMIQARTNLRTNLNPRQQLLFDQETRRLQAFSLQQIGAHYDNESNRAGHAIAEATFKNASSTLGQAIANGDSEAETASVKRMMDAGMQKLQLDGLSNNSEAVNNMLQNVRGSYVKEKVEGISLKNPFAAVQYLDKNKDALVGDEYNQLAGRYRARAADIQASIDAGLVPPIGEAAPVNQTTDVAAKVAGFAVGNAAPGGASPITDIHPAFAQRIAAMTDAMSPDIKAKFQIISGYRSAERQAQVNPSVTNSHHTAGMAVDTTTDPDVLNWINANGAKFGLGFPLAADPKEQNHLEPLDNGQRVTPAQMAGWGTTASVDTVQPTSGSTIPASPVVTKFPMPPLDPGESLDGDVPGLNDALKKINDTLPADDPVRALAAIKKARQAFNQQFQAGQQQLRLANERATIIDQQAKDQYLERMAPGSPNPPMIAEVLKDPRLTKSKENVVAFIERQNKQDPADATDSSYSTSLFERVVKPYGADGKIVDAKPIDDAYAQGFIKRGTYDFLSKKLETTKTTDGANLAKYESQLINSVKGQILGMSAMSPAAAANAEQDAITTGQLSPKQRLAAFEYQLNQKIHDFKTANKDPLTLFNPGTPEKPNPDYMGSKGVLNSYILKTPINQKIDTATHGALYNFFHPKSLQDMDSTELAAYGQINPANYDRALAEINRRGIK